MTDFVIYEEVLSRRPDVKERHESFDAAYASLAPRALFIEIDADHEGCADAFTTCGQVLSIEPATRRNL
jgi:hypothetical protein